MITYDQIFRSNLTPRQGYVDASGTMVRPAVAGHYETPTKFVETPVNGQSYGGQGMAMPQGSTAMASSAPSMGYGNAASSLISGLADAASKYVQANAIQTDVKAAPEYAVNFPVQKAELPLVNIGRR